MKNVVLAGILVVCVGIFLFGMAQSCEPKAPASAVDPGEGGTWARNMRVEIYSKDDKILEYVVETPYSKRISEDKFKFKQPVITVYGKEQTPGRERRIVARITADRGEMRTQSKKGKKRKNEDKQTNLVFTSGHLEGNVKIYHYPADAPATPDPANPPPATRLVTTKFLETDLKQDRIHTDREVELFEFFVAKGKPPEAITRRRLAKAIGMRLEPRIQRLILRRNVILEVPSPQGTFVVTSPGSAVFEELDLESLTRMKQTREIPERAWRHLKDVGALKALRVIFKRPESGRVRMVNNTTTMDADSAIVFAYRVEKKVKPGASKKRKKNSGRIEPIYLEAEGSVRMSQRPDETKDKPGSASKAAGDRFVWVRKIDDRFRDRFEEVAELTREPGTTSPLWVEYTGMARPNLLGGQTKTETFMKIECTERIVFVRNRPRKKGVGEERNNAEFHGHVFVRSSRKNRPGETRMSGADWLKVELEPVPLAGKVKRANEIRRLEAEGDHLLIEEPTRTARGRRLVWDHNYRYPDSGPRAAMHVTLTGGEEMGPRVTFLREGVSLRGAKGKPDEKRREKVTVTAAPGVGKLVFDRTVTGPKGKPMDDQAFASGGVTIRRTEIDEKGNAKGQPTKIVCRESDMFIEPPREVVGIDGVPLRRSGRVHRIEAREKVVVTMPEGGATGEKMTWNARETDDGVERITVLSGGRPSVTLVEAEPRDRKTRIDCAGKVVFTQTLLPEVIHPRIKEKRKAVFYDDVRVDHQEAADEKSPSETRTRIDGDRLNISFVPFPRKPVVGRKKRQFEKIVVTDNVVINHYRRPPGGPDWSKKLLSLLAKGDTFTWADAGAEEQVGLLEAHPKKSKTTTIIHYGKKPITSHPTRYEFHFAGREAIP